MTERNTAELEDRMMDILREHNGYEDWVEWPVIAMIVGSPNINNVHAVAKLVESKRIWSARMVRKIDGEAESTHTQIFKIRI